MRALATAPKVLALLDELYGREPLPFQTLNFRRGTQQAPHSDALHFSTIPAGFMCGVWVALEDMDMDNGPLVYYPGSHLLPEVHDAGARAGGQQGGVQALRGERGGADRARGPRAALRNDQEGPGARVGVEPAARRLHAARP